MACVAEFGACAAVACCAPHRCFRQSQFFAQCGRACPREPSWECHAERMRRVGVILSRWGSWPAWTPLLLHSFGANPGTTFLLLSDTRPSQDLPPNVRFISCTLAELLARCRRIGGTLDSVEGTSRFASGVSGSKVNDLKPLFGELFRDVLGAYDWWGHLQA